MLQAKIGTTSGSYTEFINQFRAAFRGSQPFTATYTGTKTGTNINTKFNYVVVQAEGAVDNLYLTSIEVNERTKLLHNLQYGTEDPGNINKQTLIDALSVDYYANWDQKNFDIVLLCTVEAARSEFIHKKVRFMLASNNKTIIGSELKDLAQVYRHTQRSAGITSFRPITDVDYVSHLKGIDHTTEQAQKFMKLFI